VAYQLPSSRSHFLIYPNPPHLRDTASSVEVLEKSIASGQFFSSSTEITQLSSDCLAWNFGLPSDLGRTASFCVTALPQKNSGNNQRPLV
jgi:hypothetical protein